MCCVRITRKRRRERKIEEEREEGSLSHFFRFFLLRDFREDSLLSYSIPYARV
jgi:hypothetical protein